MSTGEEETNNYLSKIIEKISIFGRNYFHFIISLILIQNLWFEIPFDFSNFSAKKTETDKINNCLWLTSHASPILHLFFYTKKFSTQKKSYKKLFNFETTEKLELSTICRFINLFNDKTSHKSA